MRADENILTSKFGRKSLRLKRKCARNEFCCLALWSSVLVFQALLSHQHQINVQNQIRMVKQLVCITCAQYFFSFWKILIKTSSKTTDTVDVDRLILSNLQSETHHGFRQKRATCDLLSFMNVWGDSLCASHCLSLRRGFRGGYCTSKRVCKCRK